MKINTLLISSLMGLVISNVMLDNYQSFCQHLEINELAFSGFALLINIFSSYLILSKLSKVLPVSIAILVFHYTFVSSIISFVPYDVYRENVPTFAFCFYYFLLTALSGVIILAFLSTLHLFKDDDNSVKDEVKEYKDEIKNISSVNIHGDFLSHTAVLNQHIRTLEPHLFKLDTETLHEIHKNINHLKNALSLYESLSSNHKKAMIKSDIIGMFEQITAEIDHLIENLEDDMINEIKKHKKLLEM